MKKVLVFCILIMKFYLFIASPESNCKISGIDNNGSPNHYTIKKPIDDAYKGIIATFNTNNIAEIISQNSKYLEASLNSNILNIYTNKNYDNVKLKDSDIYGAGIEIEILVKCIDHNGWVHNNTFIIKQEVSDAADVADATDDFPKFNQEKYEYTFGMAIPEGYKLNELQPIAVKSTGNNYLRDLYFLLELNEYFRVSYKGVLSESEDFHTDLEALQEIKPPFQKTFEIFAMNDKNEAKAKIGTASVTINVYDHVKPSLPEPEPSSHPPVFSKHLYYANYTESNDLLMDEDISFKYGVQDDISITQSVYGDYINVELDKTDTNLINVQVKKALPGSVINSLDMITIEIEAKNGNINIPGRTALLIRLPTVKQTLSNVYHDANDSVYVSNTPVILLATGMMFIILLNVIIVTWHLYKKKSN